MPVQTKALHAQSRPAEARMTYLDQWKALSSRIRGLMQAGQLHAQYLAVRSSDSYGRVKRLREQCESIVSALRAFRETFRELLPTPAVSAIDDFVAKTGSLVMDITGTTDQLQERVWAALVLK